MLRRPPKSTLFPSTTPFLSRALVNRSYHRRIAAALPPATRERLAALLVVPMGVTRSGWDQVKADPPRPSPQRMREHLDRKSTRLNSSHANISYAVFCLKKKT